MVVQWNSFFPVQHNLIQTKHSLNLTYHLNADFLSTPMVWKTKQNKTKQHPLSTQTLSELYLAQASWGLPSKFQR